MGIEVAIIIGASLAIAGASAGYSLYLMKKSGNNTDGMSPTKLDDFGVTQASEGQCIALVYGRMRIPGNILYYGNLVTEELTASAGGKGIGGGDQVSGYNYYIDCWQAVCDGKIELLATFTNDSPTEIESDLTVFNDGTQVDFPSWAGEFASSLPGIAHISLKRWFMGKDVTTIPTVHFVVKRILPEIIAYANMANGNNPAAIIYDILLQKVTGSEIDTASFSAAATYWNEKGYGLSMAFNSKQDVEVMINRVLKYVDGAVYLNSQGKYAITAFDPSDSSVATITQDDFIEFELTRLSYNETPNDFRGTFIDSDKAYSTRTVVSENAAHFDMIGRKISETIDLEAFTDVASASKRICEIKKRRSYPSSSIDFTVDLRFDLLTVGDIVTVQNSDYGIVSADFRITNIDYSTIEENKLKFKAEQVVEGLFDDVYATAGGTKWTDPDTELIASTKIAVFEMPWNYDSEEDATYLALIAREKFETNFNVLFSTTGLDYIYLGTFGTWSQYGTLDEEYPATTRDIDDSVGILYTPYKFDPSVDSISRTDLFYRRRIALIGNEMLGFQTITPEGLSSYRLTGVVRGVLNTPIETHPASSPIWITEISDRNLITGIKASAFYIKYIPRYGTEILAASLATAIPVTYSQKARIPITPFVVAARTTATNVDFQVFPITRDKSGAGAEPEDVHIPIGPAPYNFEGDFEVVIGAGSAEYKTSTIFSLTFSGAEIVTIKHRINNRLSTAATIEVGSEARKYTS